MLPPSLLLLLRIGRKGREDVGAVHFDGIEPIRVHPLKISTLVEEDDEEGEEEVEGDADPTQADGNTLRRYTEHMLFSTTTKKSRMWPRRGREAIPERGRRAVCVESEKNSKPELSIRA